MTREENFRIVHALICELMKKLKLKEFYITPNQIKDYCDNYNVNIHTQYKESDEISGYKVTKEGR